MTLSLRNKQVFILFVLIVLSLLAISFVALNMAHINLWQTLIKPSMSYPWL
ncbi:hypothetical protein [Dictyobacter arantiisoli]|uniref:Uncharacterized protein n=1 Tax=Dictyobacter arantiisoli TaxID=2014874 RepID=A0A5A5T6A6_9CHLR|nr:hypothetical protein [Dictyobacter arantiisoli]GCF06912.1 hypothetical protein KDI_04760 [Dictyobacter arantiisoli]